MEIDLRFAAKKLRVLWRVIENAQPVDELRRRSEVDEVRERIVIAADRSCHHARLLTQTDINPAAGFDTEIRIADDELERRVVSAAREKLLRGRRALREGGIHGQFPITQGMIDRAPG